jgi:hypothetical protein
MAALTARNVVAESSGIAGATAGVRPQHNQACLGWSPRHAVQPNKAGCVGRPGAHTTPFCTNASQSMTTVMTMVTAMVTGARNGEEVGTRCAGTISIFSLSFYLLTFVLQYSDGHDSHIRLLQPSPPPFMTPHNPPQPSPSSPASK